MTSLILRRILLPKCNVLPLFYCRKNIHHESSSDEEFYPNIGEESPHTPVLVEEVIKNLNLKEGDLFLDMTFGAGGHTQALLENIPNLQVFALDRDPIAQEYAKELQEKYPGQIIPLVGKFSDLTTLMTDFKVPPNTFDGILFDVGCSSMQFDTAERGFSIVRNGPLDMRMDGDQKNTLTAADVIAYADERELAQIFKIYGGEKKALKVAQAIMQARCVFQPLKTTQDLSNLIEVVLESERRYDKLQRPTKVATKVFKGLRAFVNNEINELNYGLMLAHIFLKVGGRAAVITFDSSEDQVVKRHFQNTSVDSLLKPLPLIYLNSSMEYSEDEMKDFRVRKWNALNKKVIVPSDEEVMMNPRSRSAKLRVAVKCDKKESPFSSDETLQSLPE